MKRILFCLVCITATACNSGSSKVSKDTATIGYSDSSVQVADSTHPRDRASLNYKVDTSGYVSKTLLQPRDTLLTVDLHDGKGSVKGYLSGIGKHITVMIPVTTGDSIIAEIIPEVDSMNIRFNQIYIPVGKDGKYDGPFSRKISYPVTVKGAYRLIIGSNLMAEGKTNGNFTCNIVIK